MKFYFGEKIMENGLMVQKLWRFKVEVRVKLVSISRAVLPKLLSRVLIIDLRRILITDPQGW